MEIQMNELTEQQNQIINDFVNDCGSFNHLVVNAFPGTGKTKILIGLSMRLMTEKDVKPQQILILTFNSNISKEIAKKFKDEFNRINQGQRPKICTIDSLAYQIVMPEKKNIYDYDEMKKLRELFSKNKTDMISSMGIDEKKIYKHFRIENRSDSDKEDFLCKKIFGAIKMKESLNWTWEECKKYLDNLRKNQLNDLDRITLYMIDLYEKQQLQTFRFTLCQAIQKLKQIRKQGNTEFFIGQRDNEKWRKNYDYIIVDEFQDCNKAQLDLFYELLLLNKSRRFMFFGDPDQNIYEWKFSFFSNVQKFFEQIQELQMKKIKRCSLSETFRLHENLKQLAMKFLKSDHAQITYPSIRKERILKWQIQQAIKSNQSINKKEKEHEIAIEVYSDEWDEIRMILERIYEAKYIRNIDFSKMVILLRSTKKVNNKFIQQLKFAAKQFEKEKEENGEARRIPLLVAGSTSMFKDASSVFALSLLKYYQLIHKNKTVKKQTKYEIDQESDSDQEDGQKKTKIDQKCKIIQKICKHIRGTIIQDQIGKKMLLDKSMQVLLDESKLNKMINEKYRPNSPKIPKLKQFREDMLIFLQICEKHESPKEILEYILKTFYEGQIYKDLEKNQFVEELYQIATLHEGDTISEFIQGLISQKDAYDSIEKIEKVLITTMHQSKGLTYSVVFMPCMNQNFEGYGDDEDDIVYIEESIKGEQMRKNEQFRLHFTAITRSKNSLYITRTKHRNSQPQWFSRNDPRREFQILGAILGLKQRELQGNKKVCVNKIKERYLEFLNKKCEKKSSKNKKRENKPQVMQKSRKKEQEQQKQVLIKIEDEELKQRRVNSEQRRDLSPISFQDQDVPPENQEKSGKKERKKEKIEKKKKEKKEKQEKKEKAILEKKDQQIKKQTENNLPGAIQTQNKKKNSIQITLDSFWKKKE